MGKIVKIKLKDKSQNYEIKIAPDCLKNCGGWAKDHLKTHAEKVVIISNRKVFGLYGKTVEASLKKTGYTVFVLLIGDGEKYKSFRFLEKTLKFSTLR